MITVCNQRYEIRDKIGEGGIGAVYSAFDRNLNRTVAIKRLLTSSNTDLAGQDLAKPHSLLDEAMTLSSLQHPNIVTIHDSGSDDDGQYVVMEHLEGKTLEAVTQQGAFSWENFREVAIQSLEGLIAAQSKDILHRDIKPSNVMLTQLPSGKFQVKLLDFGLAKFSQKPCLQTIDLGDVVYGSVYFMAPEQFERTLLDKRTDLYSLGCVFYHALTNKFPFDGDTITQVMASHMQGRSKALFSYRPDLPTWASQWVHRLMSRHIHDRPQSAQEALDEFFELEKKLAPLSSISPISDQSNSHIIPIPEKETGLQAHHSSPSANPNNAPTGSLANLPANNISGDRVKIALACLCSILAISAASALVTKAAQNHHANPTEQEIHALSESSSDDIVERESNTPYSSELATSKQGY